MVINPNEVQSKKEVLPQDRVRWLVAGALPLTGLALIEAERTTDAAMVADDIAGAVASGVLEWGQCWAVAGPAFVYDSAGRGEVASDAPYAGGDAPPVPPLGIGRPADFAHEVQVSGGARLLVLPASDAGPQGFVYAVMLRAIAEELQCCVLIVAGDDMSDRDLVDELRFCAPSVLRVHRDGDSGTIEQTKGAPEGEPLAWTFVVPRDEDDKPGEAIDEVMLRPPLAQGQASGDTLH